MMTKIQEDQKLRLMSQIRAAGTKGRSRKSLCYLESRHHGLGHELTIASLEQLVAEGQLSMETTGPKKFKTISDLEGKRGYVYYVV